MFRDLKGNPLLTQSSEFVIHQPLAIPENVSGGKCGMFPASIPAGRQVIFKDGTMTPSDGCKCMFNYITVMEELDKAHSRDDIFALWVRTLIPESGSMVSMHTIWSAAI